MDHQKSGKIENVIILGAGASAADGAPIQMNLFKDYFNHKSISISQFQHDFPNIAAFFEQYFGITIKEDVLKKMDFPSFEEILGIIEIALSQKENSVPLKTGDRFNINLTKLRNEFILFISDILETFLGRGITHAYTIERSHLSGLLSDFEHIWDKVAFISLNYDIIIDTVLLFGRRRMFGLDYGIQFDPEIYALAGRIFPGVFKTNYLKYVHSGEQDERIPLPLYKLHGSLNWLYCPKCNLITITPLEKGASWLIHMSIKCKKCTTEIVPIIIPPTYFKVMSNPYIQEVWHKAQELLSENPIKRLIFCGYSFPDADIHVKYLLKSFEVSRGYTPEIVIINNHENKPESSKESEKARYLRFFSRKAMVNYTDLSFQQFCQKPSLIIPEALNKSRNEE